jgi:hypothetical protein
MLLGLAVLAGCSPYYRTHVRTVRFAELTEVVNEGELTNNRTTDTNASAKVRISKIDARQVCFEVIASTDWAVNRPLSEWVATIDGARAHFHVGPVGDHSFTTRRIEQRPVSTVEREKRGTTTRYEYVEVDDVEHWKTREGWLCGARGSAGEVRLRLVAPEARDWTWSETVGADFVWRIFSDG